MKTHLIESKTHNKKSLVSHFMNVGFVNAQPYIFIHLMKEQPEKRQRVKSIGFYAYDAQHCGVFCEISFMLCFVGIFSRLHSFRIVLHHCELFIFHSNVLLFLIRHLLAQAPLIFIIPFAISECHLYMSLAHSTLLITFHLNLIVSPSQIYISEFIFFIRVIHTIPYKINFIYFH